MRTKRQLNLKLWFRSCPVRNLGQLAQLQVKASHKQAKEFRELAQKVKES